MACDLTAEPDDALASVIQGHLGFDVVHPDISLVGREPVFREVARGPRQPLHYPLFWEAKRLCLRVWPSRGYQPPRSASLLGMLTHGG